MNIAIVGYGKMGHAIEQIAQERNHKIVARIDAEMMLSEKTNLLKKADVAIEFSTPETAVANISACLKAGVRVVSGTTGWLEQLDKIKALCKQQNSAFFYASNFSIGVNIFFELNKQMAKMSQHIDNLTVGVKETHHIHKKDAPSGTAITIAETIAKNSDFDGWTMDSENKKNKIPIQAIRKDDIFGIHEVNFNSAVDKITLRHESLSRRGFAHGAVLAAEFLNGQTGYFGMKDLLGL